MPGVNLWGYDSDTGNWVRVLVNAAGKLEIASVEDAEISQATPEDMKHTPHGWYAGGPAYLPFKVDNEGKLQITLSSLAELGDIDDIDLTGLADGDILYWDDASSTWMVMEIPAAAWADITGKPTAPSLEEMAAEHEDDGTHTYKYVPRTYVWFVPGDIETGTEQGPTFRMKRATTIEDVELHVKTAPTGAALIVDILEAGTTVFTTKPEIDIGGTTEDDNHVFSDTALAAAAELRMDITQVGSTVAGKDLTVLLHCKEPVI